MSEPRTLEEFVEDMISNGCTAKEVRGIARQTHWQSQADKVVRLAERQIRILKKKGISLKSKRPSVNNRKGRTTMANVKKTSKESSNKSKGTAEMEMTRKDAIAMFNAVGFKTASKWDNAVLQKKLNNLGKMMDPDVEMKLDSDMDVTVKKIIKTVANGGNIVLLEAKETKKAAAAVHEKNSKGGETAKKKEKKEKKAPAVKKERDKWGSYPGSQAADINAVIDKKLLTIEEISKQSKSAVGRVRGHLRSLLQKGFIEKKDDKYRIK